MKNYQHLGIFGDLVFEAKRQRDLFPVAKPGRETQERIRETLGFRNGDEQPQDVRVERHWESDGLIGGLYPGRSAMGRALKRGCCGQPMPMARCRVLSRCTTMAVSSITAKKKIAIGPDAPPAVMTEYRRNYYGGQAYPNDLARAGHVVLVHDTFLWGSRRFPLQDIPANIRELTAVSRSLWQPAPGGAYPEEIAEYNACCGHHEHLVEKYCNVLGTSMAGVVCHEDRIAANYLRTRPEVISDRVGCIGLSGGGNRAAMLLATHDGVKAAVIVGLMTTYEGLLDKNISSHTWMLFPQHLGRYADWSDLASCRAPAPLLVQYDNEDDLFTLQGMHDAHERIAQHYRNAKQPNAYTGQFYPGPHKFDAEMQTQALAWIKAHL